MRAIKDLIGKPVFSIVDGRRVGTVKDLYLDKGQNSIVGVQDECMVQRSAVVNVLIQRISLNIVVICGPFNRHIPVTSWHVVDSKHIPGLLLRC